MKFSVCIPSMRASTIGAAVASIRRQTWNDWELIVAGQGDPGQMRTAVTKAASGDQRVQLLQLTQRGTSLARNTAMRVATGDVLAFMDDDCEAHPEWLTVLAELFSDPDMGAIGGALIAPPSTRRGPSICPAISPPELIYDPVSMGGRAPKGWAWVGGNMSVRTSVAREVGMFDEYLGPGTQFLASEDTDYLLRLEAAGIKMGVTSRAKICHTYGARYGFRAVYWHMQSYATGEGACAAKQTLMGDSRGEAWRQHNWRGAWDLLRRLRFDRLPRRLLKLWYFEQAYQRCLRQFAADPEQQLLEPVIVKMQPSPER